MPQIKISELYPGEISLGETKISHFRAILDRGEGSQPIVVIMLSGRHLVGDGHHRLRALIEFYRDRNQEIPPIDCIISTPSPREMPSGRRRLLEQIAGHFGKGPDAFLKMRVGNSTSGNSYEEVRDQERRNITTRSYA